VPLPRLVGVIHLPALPSSPRHAVPLPEILALAVREARALEDAGFEGVIVENFGDVPFHASRVPPATVAAMAVCVHEVRRAVRIAVGVNVLRNDASASLAVAHAAGADFVRVNVHAGARLTDQGIVRGQADRTLRERRALGADSIALWCDVDVKHAAPIAPRDIGDEAEELVERALADAVLVTGAGTGRSVAARDLSRVRERVRVPVLAASGVTAATLGETLGACDGVVIGSAFRRDGKAGAPLDPDRVLEVAGAWRAAGGPARGSEDAKR
jgi:membrane complex biogenesis BtpA family protein